MNKFYPNSRIERESGVHRPDISTKGKKHVFSDGTQKIRLSGAFSGNSRKSRYRNSRDDDGR